MASTDPSLLARIFTPGPTRDNHPAGGATGKAGRNLVQAITTAVVLIAAVAVPLFTSLPAFVGVIGFVCLVGIWELAGAFARMGITLTVTPLYVGAIGRRVRAVPGVLRGADAGGVAKPVGVRGLRADGDR